MLTEELFYTHFEKPWKDLRAKSKNITRPTRDQLVLDYIKKFNDLIEENPEWKGDINNLINDEEKKKKYVCSCPPTTMNKPWEEC